MTDNLKLTPQVQERYHSWLNDPGMNETMKQELTAIAGQAAEIEDRFYRNLEFGTGGLRGVIGAGTNRMNIYTVGKATQGLAQYLLQDSVGYGDVGGSDDDVSQVGGSVKVDDGGKAGVQSHRLSVVIAYDSRHMSPEFALETALVFAGNGIKAYLYESLRSTPQLSFTVRECGAAAGVMITASHNPPEYNGYKAYNRHGGQLVPHEADAVIAQIAAIDSFEAIQRMDREAALQEGLLEYIGKEYDERYYQAVLRASQADEGTKERNGELSVVYTPLHGAGNEAVRNVLHQAGFNQVAVVPEQEAPDGQFPTVKSPNPEESAASALAIELAKQRGADILIGTDPDADRLGAVVLNRDGEYEVMTGNQTGAVTLHYLLEAMDRRGRLPENGAVIKTIVTSELGARIAENHGMTVMNTLTGFKYIGEKMTQFEETGSHQYVFGYEESYGYLAGTHCRDKDAVVAALLVCEAAAYYKEQGQSLYEVLLHLYERYGYFVETLHSRAFQGKEGMAEMKRIMNTWRSDRPEIMGGRKVVRVLDYLPGLDGLPSENVLKYQLDDGSWFCLRPSGTEPKMKIYVAVQGSSLAEARDTLAALSDDILSRL